MRSRAHRRDILRPLVPTAPVGALALGFAALLIAPPVSAQATTAPLSATPTERSAPPSSTPPAEGSAAAPSKAPSTIEITVEGEKAPAGSTSLGRRNIREMPGVLDDPYRAVEVQPGVTPTASGIPYYFIRGAPPGNVGYFFDGIQVPLLFHVGAGPSVIPSAAIRSVAIHPGPTPASAGRFAGAIIDAESTPPSYQWRGEGSLRATDVGGILDGPVGEDVNVFAGGRFATGAPLISALVPSLALGYGDYQTRVSWRPRPDTRLSVFAFGAYDYLATLTRACGSDAGSPSAWCRGEITGRDVLLDTDFHRVNLRYDRELANGDKLRADVTLGAERSRGVAVAAARDLKLNARLSGATPAFSGKALLRGGIDVALDRYDVTPFPEGNDPICAMGTPGMLCGSQGELAHAAAVLFPDRLDIALGAWADALIELGEGSTITPGLRIDHYTSLGNSALAVDPRLVGRFGVGKHLRFVPAVALASQLPAFAPIPALQIGGIRGGLQRSLQTSFGTEVSVGPIEAVATVFRHATFNLSDAIGSGRGTGFGVDRFLTRSVGDAYGLELGARGALRRNIFFLASYTLARATRTVLGRTVPSAYDRTHTAHFALLFDLGRGMRVGVRHVFYTGFPADEAISGRPPSESPARVRPFYRLDVRASKRWKIGKSGYVGVVLDLENALLAKEVFDVSCDEHGQCAPKELGPITIPQLGLEAGF
jgi:TonB-dependent Receptor Plug Domain/TonB dependent receptor